MIRLAFFVWTFALVLIAAAFQKSYVAKPANGRFRLTIPALDWNDDSRLRPGWIQVHQRCHWLGDSWQWPEHPSFEWRWHHCDLLGFYSARIAIPD